MIFFNRRAAGVLLIVATLGLGSFAFAGQKKTAKSGKSRKVVTTNANVAPSPTPAPPPEPEPIKKNDRQTVAPPNATASTPVVAADALIYRYEFSQPASFLTHIQIEHDRDGKGTITFERRTIAEPITDPIQLSPAAWSRIKTLWETLNFLDSTKEYQTERQYPSIGTVKFTMQQGAKVHSASFNWTEDKDAAALAEQYRQVADQAIWVFDIGFARESEPLSAPDLMRQFETTFKRKGYSDVKQLVPLFRDLAIDERIPLIARNHAARLLKEIEK